MTSADGASADTVSADTTSTATVSAGVLREEGRRNRWPSLRGLRPIAAGGLVACATSLLGAAPAWAHDAHPDAFTTWDAAIVRCLVLVASALVGGVALLRPLTGPVNTATRWVVVAAAGAAAAGILEVASAGRASWPLAIVSALVTLVVPFTLGRRAAAALGGLALTVAIAVEAGAGHGWIGVSAGIAHTGAAAVWVAAAVIAAMADAGTRRALLRRLMPVAVCAGVLVATTGIVHVRLDGLRLDSTTAESGFARVVALKAALFVGVTVLGLLSYRWLLGPGTVDRARAPGTAVVAVKLSAVGLTGALVAGAALAAIDVPPAPPVPGVPLLRIAAVGGTRLPVVVVPQRPGWNLVHVGSERAAVGVDGDHVVPATTRPGAAGGWALVQLPPGQSRLWIRYNGRSASLRLDAGRDAGSAAGRDAGSAAGRDAGRAAGRDAGRAAAPADNLVGPDSLTGPDGPECVSAVLGGLAAGREMMPVACPADRLTDPDAASLHAMVKYLAGRGIRAVTILDDPSPRSRVASETVRSAAARHRLTVAPAPHADSALIVVSGWAAADATLRGVAGGEVPGLGTYLAPWLANSRLLAYRSGAVVALRYDPRDPQPLRYASDLRSRFAGATATAAGYDAWRAMSDRTAAGSTHLYAAAMISLLPAGFAHDHGVRGGWLPGGAITRVTPALED